ncbi:MULTISPECIES: DUF5808 domain-containing protein [Dactylosporangium]|uniref:DUF5808 domain-containing protein n=2 Tax=Dactylosporangium TaxID=35753 RepID=A0A9W6KK29_9ACTN|nr:MULTISPECIES: DUF5808 domain-containing protein [Dactylosporangium]UAB96191.1 hypothetical protein Dvina_51055 [Dactylosporangium vinaceum]UWZ44552.1 hypothetical protein Dmats_45640 [Dactylosporangium matsuzakiense]GLL01954.1 hypothetical protein GCM10017581_036960 [Dactylosporangium matsuzakiense]
MTQPVVAELLAIALIVAICALAVVVIPLNRRGAPISTRNRPQQRHDDERYWYGGIIYANPDDPNLFVPKRLGLGWTLNFGHRRVWQSLFGLIAFLALSIVIGTVAGHQGR